MPFNKNCRFLSFIFLLLLGSLCHADMRLTLAEPQWEFVLQNQPWGEKEATLSPAESGFARFIQPLLANQDYPTVLKAFEKRDIAKDSAALCLLRGQVLLTLKHFDAAESALKSALQRLPDLALAHRSLSMVYLLKNNYRLAQKHLRRSIELGAADAQLYGQLAYVNLQLHQPVSAVAGYQQALFLEADNTQWQNGLLYAFMQSGAFDQAQALMDDMIKREPSNALLWLQRGQLALEQEQHDRAIASLEMALQLGEKATDTVVTLAQLHIQHGSPRRAVALLDGHVSAIVKAGKIEALVQIAAWLAYQEDWENMNKLLRAVKKQNKQLPTHYAARFNVYRAQWAEAKGDYAVALKHAKAATAVDPSNGEALLLLAKILWTQQRSERAVLYYTRAAALPIFEERALLGQAQVEIDRQNYSEALRLLRTVVRAHPERHDVSVNIQALEKLLRHQG